MCAVEKAANMNYENEPSQNCQEKSDGWDLIISNTGNYSNVQWSDMVVQVQGTIGNDQF